MSHSYIVDVRRKWQFLQKHWNEKKFGMPILIRTNSSIFPPGCTKHATIRKVYKNIFNDMKTEQLNLLCDSLIFHCVYLVKFSQLRGSLQYFLTVALQWEFSLKFGISLQGVSFWLLLWYIMNVYVKKKISFIYFFSF